MPLPPGTRLGPYEVTAQIGVGGMGEVYRATDTSLKRQVAIKVLPEAVAGDAERLTRFQREAEVLASLNHPNIAAIHGLDRTDGHVALVMELVEGPTLADRIAEGAMSFDEALPIAKQIAEALEAAHEQGIVHRDLKPANVKVRPDGTVKVLDFGLAKAMAPATGASAGHAQSASPTITTPAMTQAGMILGTAAYMSPEQAKGQTVDRRSDIWAFGAVLYEMLAGRRAFAGDDVSETLASVLAREPDWDRLPAGVPSGVRVVLRQCLQRDARQRMRDIGDVRMVLDGALTIPADARPQMALGRGSAILRWGALAVIPSLVAAGWYAGSRGVDTAAPTRRIPMFLGGAGAVDDVILSSTGTFFVFRRGFVEGGLYQQRFDQTVPTRIVGTDGASEFAFLSPDGRWVAFRTGRTLYRVEVGGGTPLRVAEIADLWGGGWGPSGDIVYSASGVLYRAPASGESPEELGDFGAFWPRYLPDGRHVLFSVAFGSRPSVQVLDLETREVRTVLEDARSGRYLTSGHLIFARDGDLWAVRFDADTLTTAGNPVRVEQDLAMHGSGASAVFDVSNDGTLVYTPRTSGAYASIRTLVWVDRQGIEEPIPIEAGGYAYPRISPDGTRALLDDRGPGNPIWIWDFGLQTRARLTIGDGGVYPAWSRAGDRVAYLAPGGRLVWRSADGAGTPVTILESTEPSPYAFTEGDRAVLFVSETNDIGLTPVDGDGGPTWLLDGSYSELNAGISPDGRWLAYQSDESGQYEIYVRPFPDVRSGLMQMSSSGGQKPVWSSDGGELFYLEPGTPRPHMVSVSVAASSDGALRVQGRQRLFEYPYLDALPLGLRGRSYDVSLDGQRFLVLRETETPAAGADVVLVLNWLEELERLLPAD